MAVNEAIECQIRDNVNGGWTTISTLGDCEYVIKGRVCETAIAMSYLAKYGDRWGVSGLIPSNWATVDDLEGQKVVTLRKYC